MLKRFLFISILIFLGLKLDAQIEREISAYIDSTELIIRNGRKLLMQSVKNNDLNKTKEIYEYLNDVSLKKNCNAFGFIDELYINTLLSNWDRWIQMAVNIKNDYRNYCYVFDSQLNQVLYDQIIENIDLLLYNSNELTEEDRKIIDIYIYLLKYGSKNETYGDKIKSFKSEFKESKYNYFIDFMLPAPYEKGSFGITFGTNSMILTNNLGNSFSPMLSFSLSLDFNIDKTYLSIYFTGGDMKSKINFSKEVDGEIVDFDNSDYFSFMEYGFLVGHFLVRNNRFHVAPYFSISGSYLKSDLFSSNEDKENKEYKAFNTFVGGLGLHTEFKLFEWNMKNSGYNDVNKSNISLKIDFGYDLKASQRDDRFKGNMIYFRPALVWGMGDF